MTGHPPGMASPDGRGDASAAVTIVTVTRNRRDDLHYTLSQLATMRTSAWQVVVVANACTDGTPDMIAEEFEWVTLIDLADNRAMAATNEGLRVARAPVIMVLDDDALPAPGAVEHALNRFATEPELDAIACGVIEGGRVINKEWPRWPLKFIGAGAFFRRSVLEEIGGYSEIVAWAGNEKELVCRLVAAGRARGLELDRDCIVHHRKSPVNRSWRRGNAYSQAWATGYRFARYHGWWGMPFGILHGAAFNLAQVRIESRWQLADFGRIVRGVAQGVIDGSRDRSPVPFRARLEAGRIFRLGLRAARPPRRWLARMVPPDFWW